MKLRKQIGIIIAAAVMSALSLFTVWLATHYDCWEECMTATTSEYLIAGLWLPSLFLLCGFASRTSKMNDRFDSDDSQAHQ